ncbi:flavin-containing monooxygenase [Pseudonocardia alni]|uniref:flavin-containing monooxygenase n=1 Tax=Pseudonocardia alni TaxID=33907 RepID=UPI0033E85CB6
MPDTAVAPDPLREVRTIVVGAGFAGLGCAIRLLRRGDDSFVVLERADDVGGSWRDNTYPGVACDVPAPLYSFSFRTNPDWTRLYAPGPEIHAYLRRCADEEGVTPHLRLGADMLDARWDDAAARWVVHTSRGTFRGEFLVAATGHLTDVKPPDVPGLDGFTGTVFHSARWEHDAPLDGRRIGVVGTGASAVQIVPELADRASELVVFQRSAPYVRPRLDRGFAEDERRLFRRDPESMHELRERLFWNNEFRFAARRFTEPFLSETRALSLDHLARQVPDPVLRAALTPDYEIGCKRILASDDYYPALQRPHVTLEPSALAAIEGSTAISAAGRRVDLDVLVVATGFETFDLPSSHRIAGRGGTTLAQRWDERGMQAYNSTTVAGFPNLFLLNGPGTSLGHNSIVYMIEAQIDHTLAAMDHSAARGGTVLEVDGAAEQAYADDLDARAATGVLVRGGCSSWYLDPRHGRATLSWPDFAHRFRDRCAAFDPAAYGAAAGGR